MRHILLVGLLIASLVVPAFAASGSTLPVSGTLTSSGMLSSGSSVTLGGVTGTLTSTPSTSTTGTWSMTVGGVTFATGTYSCTGGGCSYTGTVVGSTTSFHFSTVTSSRSILGATGFPTHGAWVSTVAHWAGSNQSKLAAAGMTPGAVVSSAARDHPFNAQAADHVSGGTGGAGDHGKH